MSKRTVPFMMVCLMLALAMVAPVRAQDGGGLSSDQLALLADVQTSVTKFYDQHAYTVAGQQVSTMGIDMMGQSMAFTTTQNIAGQTIVGKDGSVVASSQSLEQIVDTAIPGSPVGMNQTFVYETILVDGETYIRFTSSEGFGLASDMYPEDWTNVTDASSNPLIAVYAANPSYGTNYLPINGFDPSLVTAISEGEADEIEGQAMRVIEIELNVAAAQTQGLYGTNQVATSQALGAVLGGGVPANPGVPSTDPVSSDQVQQFLEDMTITQRIWIGVDDQLPHRVEMTLSLDTEMEVAQLGGSLPFTMENVTTLDYTDFNGDFTIEAPEVPAS